MSMPHQCECKTCGRVMSPMFIAEPIDLRNPRHCMCADPENGTQAVPGLICKAGHTVDGDSKHE